MWVLCMQMRTSCCQFSFCGGWKFGLVCVKRNWSPRRYFPISDLGSSHFKFDLAAGLCEPGRLFQSPWKLNLSLKPNLSIPFPAVFGTAVSRQRSLLPLLGTRGSRLLSLGAALCSQLGVCIPHGVGGIWEKLNVRKPVHCCAAASPQRHCPKFSCSCHICAKHIRGVCRDTATSLGGTSWPTLGPRTVCFLPSWGSPDLASVGRIRNRFCFTW